MLREAKQSALYQPQRHRNTFFNPYLQEYVTKRIQKRMQLQTVLSAEPNKYDKEWFGDSLDAVPKKHLRLWFQNVNGLIHKGDTREFQFNIANMADAGVNCFAFTETCVNSNKSGFHGKLIDSFRQVISTGGTLFKFRIRFLREGRDSLGRWVWQEFGQSNKILRIYTVYRVNDGSEYASGENTVWSLQKRLSLQQHVNDNPRMK